MDSPSTSRPKLSQMSGSSSSLASDSLSSSKKSKGATADDEIASKGLPELSQYHTRRILTGDDSISGPHSMSNAGTSNSNSHSLSRSKFESKSNSEFESKSQWQLPESAQEKWHTGDRFSKRNRRSKPDNINLESTSNTQIKISYLANQSSSQPIDQPTNQHIDNSNNIKKTKKVRVDRGGESRRIENGTIYEALSNNDNFTTNVTQSEYITATHKTRTDNIAVTFSSSPSRAKKQKQKSKKKSKSKKQKDHFSNDQLQDDVEETEFDVDQRLKVSALSPMMGTGWILLVVVIVSLALLYHTFA